MQALIGGRAQKVTVGVSWPGAFDKRRPLVLDGFADALRMERVD